MQQAEAPTPDPDRFVGVSIRRGVVRAQLVGPVLGERETTIIRKRLVPLLESADPLRQFELDFQDVHGVCSLGLGLCVDLANLTRQRGGTAEIVAITPDLLHLFKLMKLHRLYRMPAAGRRRWLRAAG